METLFFESWTETVRTGLHIEHCLKINGQKPFYILVFDDFFDSIVFDTCVFSSGVDS